jgi:CBS-domain-containing membrane protein
MPDRSDLVKVVIGGAGGAVAIAIMELVSARNAFPLFAVPFASSIVMVMGTPDSPPAQPRPLIGGHVVCTLVGLIILEVAGPSPWAAAVAVGLSMIAMHVTRTFHPPAGVDPVIVVANAMPWSFVVAPVGAGAVMLAVFAYCWHNLFRHHVWPQRWL